MVTTTSNNSGGSNKSNLPLVLGLVFIFTILFGLAGLGLGLLNTGEQSSGTGAGDEVIAPVGGRGGLTEAEVQLNTIDFTDDEWNWYIWQGAERTMQFDLDVYIPSSHAALRHGAQQMNDALRTCNQYGTVAVISTNFSRRLTLLCEDPTNGRQFAVIIEKIKRSVDSFKNSYSELVTAFEFTAEQVQPNIAAYINGEVNIAKTGILVRLAFKAGEVFFSPYR